MQLGSTVNRKKIGALSEDRIVEAIKEGFRTMDDEGERSEEQEEIWSWGAGTDGQLGTGKLEDELLPQLLRLSSVAAAGPISMLACGGAHVIALTTGGRVLTWGRGTSGQLGHGDTANCLEPKLVNCFQNDVIVITHVSAGWSHSGFVSDGGCLFTCGDGSFGQLGHGDQSNRSTPVKVSYFDRSHVEQMACGMRHSLLLLKGGVGNQVYGFGSGKRGQLGVSVKSASLPRVASGFEDVEVASISANGDHSAALSADGKLYTWGRGFSGSPDSNLPCCSIPSMRFSGVALGWNHALLLNDNGEVFMLGGNRHGSLSNTERMMNTTATNQLPDSSTEDGLERVSNPDGARVGQIAAGSEHSALVTVDGAVMTWGWGEHGQLGLGSTRDETNPHLVRIPRDERQFEKEVAILRVYCGSGFTYVVKSSVNS
ncbi:Ultraviolet-B receptor UVR8 [Linum perenne]